MVRKKSAGWGCLKAQRRVYSANAASKTAGLSTLLRSNRRPAAGLIYASEYRLRLVR
jgi:hypothetical protein